MGGFRGVARGEVKKTLIRGREDPDKTLGHGVGVESAYFGGMPPNPLSMCIVIR